MGDSPASPGAPPPPTPVAPKAVFAGPPPPPVVEGKRAKEADKVVVYTSPPKPVEEGKTAAQAKAATGPVYTSPPKPVEVGKTAAQAQAATAPVDSSPAKPVVEGKTAGQVKAEEKAEAKARAEAEERLRRAPDHPDTDAADAEDDPWVRLALRVHERGPRPADAATRYLFSWRRRIPSNEPELLRWTGVPIAVEPPANAGLQMVEATPIASKAMISGPRRGPMKSLYEAQIEINAAGRWIDGEPWDHPGDSPWRYAPGREYDDTVRWENGEPIATQAAYHRYFWSEIQPRPPAIRVAPTPLPGSTLPAPYNRVVVDWASYELGILDKDLALADARGKRLGIRVMLWDQAQAAPPTDTNVFHAVGISGDVSVRHAEEGWALVASGLRWDEAAVELLARYHRPPGWMFSGPDGGRLPTGSWDDVMPGGRPMNPPLRVPRPTAEFFQLAFAMHAALAIRYDGDRRLDFVDLGIFGSAGNWEGVSGVTAGGGNLPHYQNGNGLSPGEVTRVQEWVAAVRQLWRKTPLLLHGSSPEKVLKPVVQASKVAWGFRYDDWGQWGQGAKAVPATAVTNFDPEWRNRNLASGAPPAASDRDTALESGVLRVPDSARPKRYTSKGEDLWSDWSYYRDFIEAYPTTIANPKPWRKVLGPCTAVEVTATDPRDWWPAVKWSSAYSYPQGTYSLSEAELWEWAGRAAFGLAASHAYLFNATIPMVSRADIPSMPAEDVRRIWYNTLQRLGYRVRVTRFAHRYRPLPNPFFHTLRITYQSSGAGLLPPRFTVMVRLRRDGITTSLESAPRFPLGSARQVFGAGPPPTSQAVVPPSPPGLVERTTEVLMDSDFFARGGGRPPPGRYAVDLGVVEDATGRASLRLAIQGGPEPESDEWWYPMTWIRL